MMITFLTLKTTMKEKLLARFSVKEKQHHSKRSNKPVQMLSRKKLSLSERKWILSKNPDKVFNHSGEIA